MRTADTIEAIRKEMNRRRRRGGAENVTAMLWNSDELVASIQRVVTICHTDGFNGDWDRATLQIEDGMDELANALRKATLKYSSFRPITSGTGSEARHSMLTTQQLMHSQAASTGSVGGRYFPYFPSVTRQDIGGEALADYFTWHWLSHGWLESVCNQVCGGEFLSREEAWEFLTSGLPKVMSHDDYKQLGLCPARTKGRILSKYIKIDGLLFMTNMVMADPKTHQVMATTDTLFDVTGHYCVEISMPKGSNNRHRVKRLVLNLNEDRYHYVTSRDTLPSSYIVEYGNGRDSYIAPHPAPYFQGLPRYIEGYAGTVMADLISVAEMLIGYYPVNIWDMLEACLTGRFPPQSSINISPHKCVVIADENPEEISSGKARTGFSAQGPTTLTVQPWVTPEVIADAWREHRKTNPSYSPSEKQADTLRFVLAHTLPGAEFRWEQLAEQWREERGELMTRSQLFKQFQRARVAILPEYEDVQEK